MDDTDFQIQNDGDNCIPLFHYRPKRDAGASRKEGRPIFKDEPYVEIIIPGNNRDIVCRPVQDKDKQRWPRQWAAFQNAEKEGPLLEGTPIEEWPVLDRTTVATCKHLGILTVESLAKLDDQGIERLGPNGRNLVKKANLYLEVSKDGGKLEELQQQNTNLQGQLESLQEKNAALESQVKELQADKPRRGRPPKQ